jgi:hypothetical protein
MTPTVHDLPVISPDPVLAESCRAYLAASGVDVDWVLAVRAGLRAECQS